MAKILVILISSICISLFIACNKSPEKSTAQQNKPETNEVTQAEIPKDVLRKFRRYVKYPNAVDKLQALLTEHSGIAEEAFKGDTDSGPMLAVSNENPEALRLILAAGASPNAPQHKKESPLSRAIYKEQYDAAKILLEHGADPNKGETMNATVLGNAVRKENVELVKLLLDKGADPNVTNLVNNTPIYALCEKPHLSQELVSLLLERGTNLNHYGSRGETPVHTCIRNAALSTLRIIATKEPERLNDKLEDSTPALSHAIIHNRPGIAKWLINQGADATLVKDNGIGPLDHAARRNFFDVMEALLKAGAKVTTSVRDEAGRGSHRERKLAILERHSS